METAVIIDQIFFVVISFILMVISALFASLFVYFLIILIKMKKSEEKSLQMVTLEVKVPKDNEIKIDSAVQMVASFSSLKKPEGFFGFLDIGDVVCFEIVGKEADIRFYVSAPNNKIDFVEKAIYAYYPTADIKRVQEPNIFTQEGHVEFGALVLKKEPFKPLKTFKELSADSLSSITSSLSKMKAGEGGIIQLLIRPTTSNTASQGKNYIAKVKKRESDPEKATYKEGQKPLDKIDEKCSQPLFDVCIRFVVNSPEKELTKLHIENIKSAFNQFNSDLNSFTSAKIRFKSAFMINFIYKFFPILELFGTKSISVLSAEEVAGIFHFPNKTVETPYINWLKAKSAPVSPDVPTKGGTFLGYGYYRGIKRPVCLYDEDRRRHVYIIGKTGVGKSVLLHDMARQDIQKGYGVCVIDPHGDLVEDLLKYIPPDRAEDVIYFDPSDTERPMGLNLMEAHTEEQKHFMTTAIINLMYKLYDPQRTGIIGPRFEHAVRNAMLTAMADEGSTFVEIVRVLTDDSYVKRLLPKVKDPVVKRYWTDQIAKTSDFHKSEVLDYIVSKFGRFITNTMMRNIIGQSKSAFDFRKVMDEGKILLVNLSKGRLGEENSNFLGLVLIPKILVAAMSRQEIPEEERRDFFLYVDEFQNFATQDFSTIMSEARKYKLNLTVANQFIGQIEEEVKNAVFGNVGTIISFRVGVTDANYLQREFQPIFNEADLINVERFHAYVKTIVNNEPVPPFSLDLTKDIKEYKKMENKELAKNIIELSRLRYGVPRRVVEQEIVTRARL
ncbi:MAG: hypothetical protein KatS3mg091_683 [Patescibacteria group bacterium]|nr:MAG: hypothetical protein KatS3mg091_683 [Patescibacteria group bacterium]